MPSKRLSFNTTLFRKNLSRFWPLWGGVSLLGSLMPLALLMTLLNPYFLGDVTRNDITQAFYSVAAGALPILTLFYAVLVGMAVWSWLYTARSVGFMHTLPLNRESVFLTCAASGFAMLLIPYAIVGALTCLILACFGLLPLLAAVQTAAAVIGYTVFYFGTATFAAMVTSNLFAMPVFYFIGHFFAVILQTLLGWFASSLVFGYSPSGDLSLTFLSPTVAFYRYMELTSTRLEDGTLETTFHGMWVIWAYALAGLALFALSYWLYRLRHSESAGDVVAYRALKPIFRYGVALCSALTLGMVLYEILWNNTFSSLYSDIVPLTACMVFAGVIGYYVASMLLAKSHKVFKGSGRGVAIVAVLVVILCAGVYFDVLGLGSRVPDAGDIRGVYVQIAGESVGLEAGDPRIEEVIALQRCLMDSEDEIRGLGKGDMRRTLWSSDGSMIGTTLSIDYYLENGKALYREYHILLRQEQWSGGGDSYEARIDHLMNSPQAALDRVTGPKSGTLVHISIWTENGGTDTDGPVKDTIYRALLEDAQAGRLPGYRPFKSQWESMSHLNAGMDLEFRYTYTSERTGEQEVDYLYRNISVSSSMTSTLQALLDAGILSAEQAKKELPTGVLNGLTIPEEAADLEWYQDESVQMPK